MARGSGRLVPFLRRALDRNLYPNLQYENSDTFYLRLPRFDKKKKFLCRPCERILHDWHNINGRVDKYIDYSTAKASFQVALNKCIYLVTLVPVGGNKRYRWATEVEIEENRRLLRLRMMRARNRLSNPPSIASSGYISCSEEENEMMAFGEGSFNELNNDQMVENNGVYEEDISDNDDVSVMQSYEAEVLDQLLEENQLLDTNQEINLYDTVEIEKLKKYLEDDSDVSCKNEFDESINEITDDGYQSISFDGMVQMPNQVVELKPLPVIVSVVPRKTYWLCTQKLKVGGILMLICEKKDIEDGNQTIQAGSISIPTNALEPGMSYEMKKSFQLDDKYFCILVPSV